MATQNSVDNSFPSGFSAVGTVTINTTGSATTTIGNASGGALTFASNGASLIAMNNAALTINTGTGNFGLSTDATNATCNFGTGAGVKVVTVGSTSTTSSTALKCGTADFTVESATGVLWRAESTGEITMPLQSAFLAYNSVTDADQTGDATAYTIICDTIVYDQNSDYNSGTGTYTAPITARILSAAGVYLEQISVLATALTINLVASNRTAQLYTGTGAAATTGNIFQFSGSTYIDMDAADVLNFSVTASGTTKTIDIFGAATNLNTFFSAAIAC